MTEPPSPPLERTVVVTGCSSGIGLETALRLADGAFHVVATVRRQSDADALLDREPRIETLILDIAQRQSVKSAGDALKQRFPGGIDGLVNNAGIAVAGPTQWLTREQWRRQFEVNVFGTIDVTTTLLPLVQKKQGRIVNVGSAAAHMALPLVGPYASSKFALEGFTDSLRRELASIGVAVSLIVPGQTDTGIFAKSEDQTQQAIDQRTMEEPYHSMLMRLRELMHRSAKSRRPSDRVAIAIERALTARRPRDRYYVGWDAQGSRIVRSFLPAKLVDWMIARKLTR